MAVPWRSGRVRTVLSDVGYAELNDQTCALAGGLRRLGIENGGVVGL